MHLSCLRVSRFSLFSSSFICRNIIVIIHFFHKLVFSARLYMKKASWGCCVSVLDSSGEPVALPGIGDSVVPVGFGTEYKVGHTT